jgi:membrane-bound lytic murein transglycosylase D
LERISGQKTLTTGESSDMIYSALRKRFRNFGLQITVVASYSSVVFILLSLSAFANVKKSAPVTGSDDFPQPKILQPNVEFWIKVYAIYPTNTVLLHDSENLAVIYEIIDFNDLFANPDAVGDKTKWKKVDDRRKKYKNILLSLASKIGTNRPFTVDEEKVLKLFPARDVKRARLLRAARNIRGQLGLKDRFQHGLQRSGLYRDKILETLKTYGLPPELAILPHVESEFNYKAYSKVGAAGLWQFTRSTGRRFMKINYDVDERFDPVKATESAAKLLKINYELLGSWPLAITAYNHGPNGMKRAKSRYGDDIGKIVQNYRSRSFGFASRNFYSEFLAAKHVVENYERYFGRLEFLQPIDYETFKTDKYYSVNTIIKTFKITSDELKKFNPALRNPVLSRRRRIPKNYYLHIPNKPGIDEKALWASISPAESFSDQVPTEWYKVRRGDNLTQVARRLRTSVQTLVVHNNLDNAHRIYVGQILRVPLKDELARPKKKKTPVLLADASNVAKPDSRQTARQPIVVDIPPAPILQEEGEKTTESAELFALSNGLATPESEMAPPGMRVELAPGDNGGFIYIPSNEPAPAIPEEHEETVPMQIAGPVSEWIVVEPEETLGHYAEWLEVATNKLRRLNDLAFGEEIQIGQKLHLTFDKVNPREFQRRRLEYQQSIEEDFYAAWQVEGVRIHSVRRGQNIWFITNTLYDLPLWLIARYNPGKNLRDLHIGDKINIPIVVENLTGRNGAM